jgi:hypothetical protein
MTAVTLDRSDARTPEQRAETRFAARRAQAAAQADVSVCENQALSRAASEALVARRRRESARNG